MSDDLREHVLVSPLSAFEVISQLCITNADEVWRQIQAIHNWINPKRARLLPWPDDVLASVGSERSVTDEDFTERMQTAFNAFLSAHSAESLREEACKLKNVMDAMKLKTAQDFGRRLEAARTELP